MKFEEKTFINAINVLENNIFIYFLMQENEVVYIGQTKKGFARIFQHTDKVFDNVNIIKCKINELDLLEDKFIVKYNPKYNKTLNSSYKYSLDTVKKKIRANTLYKTFSLFDLKKCIKKLDINYEYFNGKSYLTVFDYENILNYLIETQGE